MTALAEVAGAAPETLQAPERVAVSDAEYFRLLGYPPDAAPSGRALELAAETRRWYDQRGHPWSYFREARRLSYEAECVRIDGIPFRSPGLRRRFEEAGVDRVVLAAASAGAGCEERARALWQEGKPDEYFFLEMYGSAVVESLVAGLNGRICGWAEAAGRRALPHYSPGYDGWDVAEQPALLTCLDAGRALTPPEPLRVLASGMLVPRKSLLALIGLTPPGRGAGPETVPCADCSFSPCQYRRRPYRHGAAAPGPAATGPAYRIAERALRKWAAERVALAKEPDGSVRARFRFDGTTCAHLELAFDYDFVLGPASEGWRLHKAACGPVPGDEGHRQTCAYQADAEALQRALAAEAPSTGLTLDQAMALAAPGIPSGCHCTAEGRAHKWSMALQAVHFALRLSHDQTL
ncbi:MAG TPA: hypothetical protein VHV47_10250 [Opitutaceae bacterium]|nr:hypothetical protein [Opitutaceae bacterium]